MEELNKKYSNEVQPQKDPNNVVSAGSKKILMIVIGVAVVLLAAIWIWKSVEINSVKKEAERERQVIKEEAVRQVVQTNVKHLQLLAKAYVWAVRGEMMQGNINQVNLFANDMVKEKNFQRIVIANDKGIIISSTNKKDEGLPFSTVGKDTYLSSNNTTVENLSDSVLVMSSPIMGFNNRIGTLMINYAVQPPSFK
jgi:uncharacterized protein YxeA